MCFLSSFLLSLYKEINLGQGAPDCHFLGSTTQCFATGRESRALSLSTIRMTWLLELFTAVNRRLLISRESLQNWLQSVIASFFL